MTEIPLLTIGNRSYPDVSKPVVAWLPGSADVVEFETLIEAQASMRNEWINGNQEARFAQSWIVQNEKWVRVIPEER